MLSTIIFIFSFFNINNEFATIFHFYDNISMFPFNSWLKSLSNTLQHQTYISFCFTDFNSCIFPILATLIENKDSTKLIQINQTSELLIIHFYFILVGWGMVN